MNERQHSELDNWSVVTRIFSTLEMAMDGVTPDLLKRANSLIIWPVQSDIWMIIIKFPVNAN